MFKKVLIANRGEIAVQIIRALRELNIKSVAVYSTIDENELFVKLADEAVCIGRPNVSDSYLNKFEIINTAILTGCDAIHPGYGFLSENAEFADMCVEHGLKFIGPSASVISLMGNKANARTAMIEAGLPVIPGSHGNLSDLNEAKIVANKVGYPILLKASAGGGGKGIRVVKHENEMEKAFLEAKLEAQNAFGDSNLYLEKIISNARHIEMQFLADTHGKIIYFPERDCSLQRNHQKVIEITPSKLISTKEREYLGQLVIKAVKKINYENTGTIEFLMDSKHRFYFMEMNTRLQVEHTITEEITGVSFIKEQIKIAMGQPMSVIQPSNQITKYAIECRINAEDVNHGFMPVVGKVEDLYLPTGTYGVRIDTGIMNGSYISPYYDSMICKLIVKDANKHDALIKMNRVLQEFNVAGIKTNCKFLQALLDSDWFNNEYYSTNYIEKVFTESCKNNGTQF